ncbi:MAG: RDD family protein [Archangium sp.]|nr:RDD family protein [Archangium sp.]
MSTAIDAPVRLDGTHTVLTPEYVEFNFVLAGLMSRFLALLVDTVLSLIITYVLFIVVLLISLLVSAGGAAVGGAGVGESLFGLGVAAQFVIWFLIDWGYMVLLETAWSGQTVGKKMMGLRVIQDTGVRVGVYQSLLRNLVRPLDKLPIFYLVGGVAALFSGTQQRVGDLLAGTIVVRERRLKIPAQLERPDGDTSLLADPDFRARVAKLSAEEETVLFSAALRREELGMEARLNLFATLARRLEEDLGFTKPGHLSDEKLVLLVTAALAAKNAQKRKAAPPPLRFLQR